MANGTTQEQRPRGSRSWSPMSPGSTLDAEEDRYWLHREVDLITRALAEEGELRRGRLGELVGCRYWGPGRFSRALKAAVKEGRIEHVGFGRYGPAKQIRDSRAPGSDGRWDGKIIPVASESDRIRRRVRVSGHVQGVFFRDSTREQAEAHDVNGWVTNNPDGSVEAVLEGPPDAVEHVVAYMKTGPDGARVDGVEITEEAPQGTTGFRVN